MKELTTQTRHFLLKDDTGIRIMSEEEMRNDTSTTLCSIVGFGTKEQMVTLRERVEKGQGVNNES